MQRASKCSSAQDWAYIIAFTSLNLLLSLVCNALFVTLVFALHGAQSCDKAKRARLFPEVSGAGSNGPCSQLRLCCSKDGCNCELHLKPRFFCGIASST